jgi:hypothetical protein
MKRLFLLFWLVMSSLCAQTLTAQQVLPSPAFPCTAGTWRIAPNIDYAEWATINVCQNSTYYLTPVCVVGYTLTGLTANTTGVSIDLSVPDVIIPFNFFRNYIERGYCFQMHR